MTFDNDFKLSAKDDYDFWDKWVKFLGIHLTHYLPDLQRHIYVTALTLPHEDPFNGKGKQELIKKLNNMEYKGEKYFIDGSILATYKNRIKNKGWLNQDGTLIKNVGDVRKIYVKEAEMGIRSLSLIYKIWVC